MEAEYSLPQHTNVMNPIPEEAQLRRLQPEPYASSAIYTELNYQVCLHLYFLSQIILLVSTIFLDGFHIFFSFLFCLLLV